MLSKGLVVIITSLLFLHFQPNNDAATYLTTTTDNQLLIATDEKGKHPLIFLL